MFSDAGRACRSAERTDLDDPGRGEDVVDVGSDPAHTDSAPPVAGGVEPVGHAGIAVGDDEPDAAVGLELRPSGSSAWTGGGHSRASPSSGCGGRSSSSRTPGGDLDDQRLVFGQVEVGLVPFDLGILELAGLV